MKIKPTCIMCDSDRVHLNERERDVSLDGIGLKVSVRMHWCESCGSEMTLNEDLRFNARAMRQLRKKHYGLLTGQEVRAIRKRLQLSQEQAALIFGGGPVAFSKYENDEVSQSEAMDRLIWLVGNFPQLVTALATKAKVELSLRGDLLVAKHQIQFDSACFQLAHDDTEANLQALSGFDEIDTASNDSIYHMSRESRPAKWSNA